MKKKITRILGVALTLMLLTSLMVGFAVMPASAGDLAWSKSNLPGVGADGNWFRDAKITAVGPLDKAIDGTLYCYVHHDTSGDLLMKSTDEGRKWSKLGKYAGSAIVDFAMSSKDASILYIVDGDKAIYKSIDAGSTFTELSTAGIDAADPINSIDVGYIGGGAYLFVGTSKGGAGDAYSLDESTYGATWDPLALGMDVYDIRTSPNFADEANPQLVAVAGTDGVADSFTFTGGGGDADTFTFTGGGGVADAFTITFAVAADSGNITVGEGSVLATPSAGATVNGAGVPVAIIKGATVPWATLAGAGTIVVEATSNETVVTWTQTGNATAVTSTDDDLDMGGTGIDVPAGDPWTLPDCGIVVGTIDVTAGSVSVEITNDPGDDASVVGNVITLPDAADEATITATANETTGTLTVVGGGNEAVIDTDTKDNDATIVPVAPAIPPVYTFTLPDCGTVVGTISFTTGSAKIEITVDADKNATVVGNVITLPDALDMATITAIANDTTGTFTVVGGGSETVAAFLGASIPSTPPVYTFTLPDGCGTFVCYKYGNAVWETNVALDGFVALGADIAFPSDYSSDEDIGPMQFWVVADGGGIFRIVHDTAIKRDTGVTDYVSVDVAGGAGVCTILGGTADGKVRQCTDGLGNTWDAAKNEPSGSLNAFVVMADDFADSGTAFAAVSVTGAAFSRQVAERVWAQTSLIATADTATLTDVAFGSARFQITNNTDLWRYDGNWERVQVKTTAIINAVKVSPDFATDNTVFWADFAAKRLYRSTNGGSHFPAQLSVAPDTITSFVPLDASTVIVGATDGTYKTTNNGTTWGSKAGCGTGNIISFAVSDSTILAGASDGEIYKSTDAGKKWSHITKGTFSGDDKGNVFVAFDPGFADNGIFYAAGDDGTDLVVDRYEDGWKNILKAATDEDFGKATGLVCSADGTLYATSDAADGVFRSLNPTAKPDNVKFEQVTKDIDVALANLRLTSGSNILWGTEAKNVWTYNDTLTGSPTSLTVTAGETAATLKWNAMTGANKYEAQVNDSSDFKGLAADPDKNITSPVSVTTTKVTDLDRAKTYYARVRVASDKPVLSRWSEVVSFTTKMGAAGWSPFPTAGNFFPAAGATGVDPIQTLFQWNPSAGAEGYEFQLSDNAAFAGADTKKIKAPAYQWPGDLDFGKTYYWRVRAYKAGTTSAWATAIFTTAEEPVAPTPPVVVQPPPPPPTPTVIPTAIPDYLLITIIAIGAVLVIALIVLIVKTRRVA